MAEAIELYTKALGTTPSARRHIGVWRISTGEGRAGRGGAAAPVQIYYEALVTDHDQGTLRGPSARGREPVAVDEPARRERHRVSLRRARSRADGVRRALPRANAHRGVRLDPGSYLVVIKAAGYRMSVTRCCSRAAATRPRR